MDIKLDVQGHRGCRGLMPENTFGAFAKAIELGVDTLELDVVISKDHKVVISHEPWMCHSYCLDPMGNRIDKESEKLHNFYAMDYKYIKQYDCGSLGNPFFDEQKKVKSYKPLLSDLFEMIQAKYSSKNIFFNIELKIVAKHIGLYHPDRKCFVDLVVDVIEACGMRHQVSLQSFDIGAVQYMHQAYPQYPTVFLVENLDGYKKNIERLGFVPRIYSPYFMLVTPALVQYAKSIGMRIITWTVNDPEDMLRLIRMGVDGIASDYPDRLLRLLDRLD